MRHGNILQIKGGRIRIGLSLDGSKSKVDLYFAATEKSQMITVDELIKKVRELASASPDNRYHAPREDGLLGAAMGCYNTGYCDNGTKGCIFGQAFRSLGVDTTNFVVNILKTLEQIGIRTAPVRDVADEYWFVEGKEEWCCVVQSQQDRGFTWGEAVAKADARLNSYLSQQEGLNHSTVGKES